MDTKKTKCHLYSMGWNLNTDTHIYAFLLYMYTLFVPDIKAEYNCSFFLDYWIPSKGDTRNPNDWLAY